MVNYLNRFQSTLLFLLHYVLFYGGLLMLKAASKLRNFSFSMWLVFCLFVYLLKPLWLLTFCCIDIVWYWATLHMFFSLIIVKKRRPACRPPTRVWGIEFMEFLSHREVERAHSKDGWDVTGKRSSLIKYPKDGVIHGKVMQR